MRMTFMQAEPPERDARSAQSAVNVHVPAIGS
jgi:hypothetical protein